ncbi:hypothetical protein ACETIH_14070 [Microvirga arabica]|uniref:Uncharacterized protein n=1 Tax=Microvirga arabica TaxID=1128671 RepID=A0ABV6Y9B1_9HYPH
MADATARQIAVGDEVRVHFHPPGSMRSFFEGVVSRVDVTTAQGRFFAVEVKDEVILDREHRIRPGFHDYVSYEPPNDFPGRIQVLSAAAQELEREPASDAMSLKPLTEAEPQADEQHQGELEVHSDPEIVQAPEPAISFEPTQVGVEPQPASTPRGLIGALFGRK